MLAVVDLLKAREPEFWRWVYQLRYAFKLPARRLISTYQYEGQVFALWYSDSNFPADPLLEHQVLFGVVRFSFSDNGEFAVAHEDTLALDFVDRSTIEDRQVTSHLLHDGRIIFAFSEKFTGDGKWGKHNYVIAYNIEKAIWEIGYSRSSTGDIKFKPWSSALGSRQELSISSGELELFLQNGQLKVGIDNTCYHLDDWTKNTDFTLVAPNAEARSARLQRQGTIFITEIWSGKAPNLPDYGLPIPLIDSDTKIKACICGVPCSVAFENIRELVLRYFEELHLLDDLCYPAQIIHREGDQTKLPLIQTLSKEEKGVPLTGKLSDLLLSHPAAPVAPPRYRLIPAVRYSDSVLVRNQSGLATAALAIDVLRRTSCILFVPLPDLVQ